MAASGADPKGQQQGHGGGKGQGKKGGKKDKPKMTKEERRAKFLRPKKHQQSGNRPGSFKRHSQEQCFGCRKRGHRLSECPEKGKDFAGGLEPGARGRICFNCGSQEHRLALCPKPKVNGAWEYRFGNRSTRIAGVG